ncbi:MAG: hypothetical protein QM817_17645 [Archangium sp.]
MGAEGSPQHSLPAFLVAAAVVAMGYTLQWTHGHYVGDAIAIVATSLVFVLLALSVRARIPIPVLWVVGGSIAAQLYLMSVVAPTIEMTGLRDPRQMLWFHMGLAVTGVLAGSALGEKPPLPRAWFPLVLAVWTAMAVLILKLAPNPLIDVFTVEVESLQALLHGTNPYGITFANPYGDNSPFFPPGVSVNGRLQFGFVYPPLALLLCLPGYLAFGDPRYSMLAAMVGAALLMGYSRPGAWPKLVAVVFLFTPRAFFVLDRAWTDSFVVLLTALVAFVALRFPKYLFIAAGLYLALKQHMFIGIPALMLLIPRPWTVKTVVTLGLKAGGVALLVTLPFVAWGPAAFVNSVLNIREVYRLDSLGLVAHLANQNIVRMSKWSGLLGVIPVAALTLWRAPRSAAGFALAAGATHFMLYFLSTHAFCNEYYNVIGSLCVALAVWGAGPIKNVDGAKAA